MDESTESATASHVEMVKTLLDMVIVEIEEVSSDLEANVNTAISESVPETELELETVEKDVSSDNTVVEAEIKSDEANGNEEIDWNNNPAYNEVFNESEMANMQESKECGKLIITECDNTGNPTEIDSVSGITDPGHAHTDELKRSDFNTKEKPADGDCMYAKSKAAENDSVHKNNEISINQIIKGEEKTCFENKATIVCSTSKSRAIDVQKTEEDLELTSFEGQANSFCESVPETELEMETAEKNVSSDNTVVEAEIKSDEANGNEVINWNNTPACDDVVNEREMANMQESEECGKLIITECDNTGNPTEIDSVSGITDPGHAHTDELKRSDFNTKEKPADGDCMYAKSKAAENDSVHKNNEISINQIIKGEEKTCFENKATIVCSTSKSRAIDVQKTEEDLELTSFEGQANSFCESVPETELEMETAEKNVSSDNTVVEAEIKSDEANGNEVINWNNTPACDDVVNEREMANMQESEECGKLIITECDNTGNPTEIDSVSGISYPRHAHMDELKKSDFNAEKKPADGDCMYLKSKAVENYSVHKNNEISIHQIIKGEEKTCFENNATIVGSESNAIDVQKTEEDLELSSCEGRDEDMISLSKEQQNKENLLQALKLSVTEGNEVVTEKQKKKTETVHFTSPVAVLYEYSISQNSSDDDTQSLSGSDTSSDQSLDNLTQTKTVNDVDLIATNITLHDMDDDGHCVLDDNDENIEDQSRTIEDSAAYRMTPAGDCCNVPVNSMNAKTIPVNVGSESQSNSTDLIRGPLSEEHITFCDGQSEISGEHVQANLLVATKQNIQSCTDGTHKPHLCITVNNSPCVFVSNDVDIGEVFEKFKLNIDGDGEEMISSSEDIFKEENIKGIISNSPKELLVASSKFDTNKKVAIYQTNIDGSQCMDTSETSSNDDNLLQEKKSFIQNNVTVPMNKDDDGLKTKEGKIELSEPEQSISEISTELSLNYLKPEFEESHVISKKLPLIDSEEHKAKSLNIDLEYPDHTGEIESCKRKPSSPLLHEQVKKRSKQHAEDLCSSKKRKLFKSESIVMPMHKILKLDTSDNIQEVNIHEQVVCAVNNPQQENNLVRKTLHETRLPKSENKSDLNEKENQQDLEFHDNYLPIPRAQEDVTLTVEVRSETSSPKMLKCIAAECLNSLEENVILDTQNCQDILLTTAANNDPVEVTIGQTIQSINDSGIAGAEGSKITNIHSNENIPKHKFCSVKESNGDTVDEVAKDTDNNQFPEAAAHPNDGDDPVDKEQETVYCSPIFITASQVLSQSSQKSNGTGFVYEPSDLQSEQESQHCILNTDGAIQGQGNDCVMEKKVIYEVAEETVYEAMLDDTHLEVADKKLVVPINNQEDITCGQHQSLNEPIDTADLGDYIDAAVDQMLSDSQTVPGGQDSSLESDDRSIYDQDEEKKPKLYSCDADMCGDADEPLCSPVNKTVRQGSPPSSCFKWKYTPSCDISPESVVPELPSEDQIITFTPLKTCGKPLRLGLSRRQPVNSLHKIKIHK